MQHETTHRVVILGGGFGGVFTAKRLRRYAGSGVEVVLISRHNFFVFNRSCPRSREAASPPATG